MVEIEEIWVINNTERKLKIEVKEILFYHGDDALPKETVMEDINGGHHERRIIVEIYEEKEEKKGE